MKPNDSNSRGENREEAHSKVLKRELHLRFFKHVDLFCIFWLILRKRLRIYNRSSQKQLLWSFDSLLNRTAKDSLKKNGSLRKYIANSSWPHIIKRFTLNLESKLGFRVRKGIGNEPLTPEDFSTCTIALGREPFGLYSLLKGCVCPFACKPQQSDDLSSTFELFVDNQDEHRIVECTKCPETSKNNPLVGVVTPFVLSSHEEFLDESGPVRKKQKTSNDPDKVLKAFEANRQLYSGKENPLEPIFGTYGTDKSEGSREHSYRLSDLLFELVSVVLDGRNPEGDYIPAVLELAKMIRDNVCLEQPETGGGDGLFEVEVLKKLVNSNREMLVKVAKLKPFPTTYWLIDRRLVTEVSKLEGRGLIKDIQGVIDAHVSEYDRSNDRKSQRIISLLVQDSLSYMLRRFGLTHPALIELMYNIILNSNAFFVTDDPLGHPKRLDYLNLRLEKGAKKNGSDRDLLFRALSILNTLRTQAVGGTRDFLHIKCLHTSLASEIAGGTLIGSLVSRLIF